MKAHHIPNLISIIRFMLIPPTAWYLSHERADLALLLFTIAGLSDGVDGLLARRYGWGSRLGSILDPLADKFMVSTIYLCLGWLAILPWWLVLTVLGRDLLIIGGALAYHLAFGHYSMEPHILSKLNTVLQILLVVVALASMTVVEVPALLVDALVWLVLLSTLLSGATYFRIWFGRAKARLRHD